jgi:hypothetical protein
MVIDDCVFQGEPSIHPNDVSEALHLHQIHNNVQLEVVESIIIFFLLTDASKV